MDIEDRLRALESRPGTLDKLANGRCRALHIDSAVKEKNVAPRRQIFTCLQHFKKRGEYALISL
jgi:hypothetical protein